MKTLTSYYDIFLSCPRKENDFMPESLLEPLAFNYKLKDKLVIHIVRRVILKLLI